MRGAPSPRLVASNPGRLRFGPTAAAAFARSTVEFADVHALLEWRSTFALDHAGTTARLQARATERLNRANRLLENGSIPSDRRAVMLTRAALDTEIAGNEALLELYLPAAVAACDARATYYGHQEDPERAARWLQVGAMLAWHFGDLSAAEARLRLTINALGSDAPRRYSTKLPALVESRGDVRWERGNVPGAMEDYTMASRLSGNEVDNEILHKVALLDRIIGNRAHRFPSTSPVGSLLVEARRYVEAQQRATEVAKPRKPWWECFDDLQAARVWSSTLYIRMAKSQHEDIAKLMEYGQTQQPARYSANTLLRLLIVREHRTMELQDWPDGYAPLLELGNEAKARINDKSRGEATFYIRLKERETAQWKALLAHYQQVTNPRMSAAELVRRLIAKAVGEMSTV